MRAWGQLTAERSHTITGVAAPMGAMVLKSKPGVIPWSAVDHWLHRHGHGGADAAFWHRCIAILDHEYLSWWAEREGP